jgi:hypothetical protein
MTLTHVHTELPIFVSTVYYAIKGKSIHLEHNFGNCQFDSLDNSGMNQKKSGRGPQLPKNAGATSKY